MFSKVPPRVMKFAQYVSKKFFNGKAKTYTVNKTEKIWGIKNFLQEVSTYYPDERVGQINQGISVGGLNKTLSIVNQHFTKNRVHNKNHHRWGRFSSTISKYIDDLTNWGERAQYIEDVRTMFNTTIPSLGNHTLEYYLQNNLPQWKSVWSPLMCKIILGQEISTKSNSVIEFVGNAGQVAVLGANIGSTMKQTLSNPFFLASDKVSFGMWLKALPKGFLNTFRLNKIQQLLEKYNGKLIERFENGDLIKSYLTGKVGAKIAEVVLKPMEFVDKYQILTTGFEIATQIIDTGIKNGTFKLSNNPKVAKTQREKYIADTLAELVLWTQSNSDPMFMSRLRSGDYDYIAQQMFGRFASDAQNKTQGVRHITTEKIMSDKRIKAYEEASKNPEYSEEEQNIFKEYAKNEKKSYQKNYGKNISKLCASLLLAGIGEVLISELVKRLYGKKDWEEKIDPKDALKDIFLESTVNWLPYVGTIANAIENNSDVSAFTVDRLNDLVDTVKQVVKAFDTKKESDIKRAIISFIKEGLGLVGIPAKNMYNIFMGIWYQIDKEGSLSAQSWVKGYESSYMKSQFTKYAGEGLEKRAQAQLGAWSSMYSTNITDEGVLRELVYLAKEGYSITPSATIISYKDEETGSDIMLTEAQQRTFMKANSQVNGAMSDLFNLTEYKSASAKERSSMVKKLTSTYSSYAKYKAIGIKSNSKLATLLEATNGDINLAKYIAGLQAISNTKAVVNKTRQEIVTAQVNKMIGMTKSEKLLLLFLAGYKVSEKNSPRLISLLRQKGMTTKEAKEFINTI